MAKIIFNTDMCKGCGICVESCPKKLIEIKTDIINAKGHHPAGIKNESECVGCASCATMCPDCVITLKEN